MGMPVKNLDDKRSRHLVTSWLAWHWQQRSIPWCNQRLGFWSHFVRQTLVKRLHYSDGFVHLAAVRQAILTDLATIG